MNTINKVPYFDPFSFPDLTKSAIGFDDVVKKINQITETLPKIPTYPPYNIRKVEENKYVIEVAVAGFGSQDIEVEIEDGTLIIKGNVSASSYPATEYIFKGIADRAFTRKFSLADTVVVRNADLMNGMLKIMLERLIPEGKKPKKIKINEGEKSEKQFLAD
jgi:molecular chaperone IbpA